MRTSTAGACSFTVTFTTWPVGVSVRTVSPVSVAAIWVFEPLAVATKLPDASVRTVEGSGELIVFSFTSTVDWELFVWTSTAPLGVTPVMWVSVGRSNMMGFASGIVALIR